MQAEAQVGVDGVRARVLFDVGTQLVDQPDPAALVAVDVQHDAASLGGDGPQCRPQLHPAVAAERAEGVPGQAFRVHPGQQRLAVPDLAEHQREVHVPGGALERACAELAVRGGDRCRRHLERRRPAVRRRCSIHAPDSSFPRRPGFANATVARGSRSGESDLGVKRRAGRPTAVRGPAAGRSSRPWTCPSPAPARCWCARRTRASAPAPSCSATGACWSPDLPIDERIGSLGGTFSYPFPYGYSCVGEVERSAGPVPAGTLVFAFHPHQDRFVDRRRTTSSRCPRAPTRERPRSSRTSRPGCSSASTPGRWRRRPSPSWVSVRSA